ncbi:MAG: hypothetical protein JNK66_05795 [Chitinophagales bacterium]|nr:hypothetical protein [Chitinophagales bacterium]
MSAITKPTNWETPGKRFVCFMDIMGFKDYVYRNSHGSVDKKMNEFYEIIRKYKALKVTYATIGKPTKKNRERILVKSVMFSDSIVLITKDDSSESAFFLVSACAQIVGNCLSKDIGIKAAISYGNLTCDFKKSLFYGKGLVDAYLLQEELGFYGCILDHRAERKIDSWKEKSDITMGGLLKELRVPLKSGLIRHTTVDTAFLVQDISKIVKGISKTVSGKPRIYVDNTETVMMELKRIEQERILKLDELTKNMKNK